MTENKTIISQETDKPSPRLRLRRADLKKQWQVSLAHQGAHIAMLRGIDIYCEQPGGESICFEFPGRHKIKLKSTKGFFVSTSYDESKRATLLGISAAAQYDEDLFAMLVLDLLELADGLAGHVPAQRCALVVKRLQAWRQFMQDRSRNFTDAQELGLAGEILFLTACLKHGVLIPSVQEFWTGPRGNAKDFTFCGSTFVEVKTSTEARPLRAKIDSLEQLDTTGIQKLYLAAITLEKASSEAADSQEPDDIPPFKTLAEIADAAEGLLPSDIQKLEFRSNLLTAGFSDEQREQCTHRFKLTDLRLFEATALPRLTPGSIPGIISAKYEIELLDASGAPVAPNALLDSEQVWEDLRQAGAEQEPDDVEDELA